MKIKIKAVAGSFAINNDIKLTFYEVDINNKPLLDKCNVINLKAESLIKYIPQSNCDFSMGIFEVNRVKGLFLTKNYPFSIVRVSEQNNV